MFSTSVSRLSIANRGLLPRRDVGLGDARGSCGAESGPGRSAGPKQWSADPHRSDEAGNPGQGQDSDVLRQRPGGPGRHDDELETRKLAAILAADVGGER